MTDPIDPPFAIQIELTEGCNLFCDFCGLRGIREKPMTNLRFASMDTMKRIAQFIADSGWNPRLEFAMHGEPTLHPEFLPIVEMFRRVLPSAHMMLTTNGYGFLYAEDRKKRPPESTVSYLSAVSEVFNVIAIDAYEYAKLYPQIIERIQGRIPFAWYPEDPDANPHTRRGKWDRDVVFIQDITTASKGSHSTLINHAGCAFPPDHSKDDRRCAKPFRELAFRWDGHVAVCCNDWRGVYIVCNVNDEESLADVWHHERWDPARRALYEGDRRLAPCHGCNAVSTRVGLLPDKKGQHEYPAPDQDSWERWQEIIAAGPIADVVQREWEK